MRVAGIWGPYPHGDRWRLIVREQSDGAKVPISFSTREDATIEKAQRLGVTVESIEMAGDFQRPQSRIVGASWIYFVRPIHGRRTLVKIGRSANLRQRFLAIAALAGPIEILGVLREGKQWTEAALHERFAKQRRDAEWFSLSGRLAAFIASTAEPYAEIVRVVAQTKAAAGSQAHRRAGKKSA